MYTKVHIKSYVSRLEKRKRLIIEEYLYKLHELNYKCMSPKNNLN